MPKAQKSEHFHCSGGNLSPDQKHLAERMAVVTKNFLSKCRPDFAPSSFKIKDLESLAVFRQMVENERCLVVDHWAQEEVSCKSEIFHRVLRRIRMIKGDLNRALFKVGMLKGAEVFMCPGVGLDWIQSSLDIIRREFGAVDGGIYAWYCLISSRYAFEVEDYDLCEEICGELMKWAKDYTDIQCLAEVPRIKGKALMNKGDFVGAKLAFEEALSCLSGESMPALENRVLSSMVTCLQEIGDSDRIPELEAKISKNDERYSLLDNCDVELEKRMMWNRYEPRVLRKAG